MSNLLENYMNISNISKFRCLAHEKKNIISLKYNYLKIIIIIIIILLTVNIRDSLYESQLITGNPKVNNHVSL
jgi:hypothetical protein